MMERSDTSRCFRCFRPAEACICRLIPSIPNRTGVLILQHVAERWHAFNTARIVNTALERCRLEVDHNCGFRERPLAIAEGAALLFPSSDAQDLSDLGADERPNQLVVIDGTWHQAKTIVRDTPQLQDLPRVCIRPQAPGRYRIRREPTETALSTLEATVAALKALEPETTGLDELLVAFEHLIETQLTHPAGHDAWRRKRVRGPSGFPRALLKPANQIVVAYGETMRGKPAGDERTQGKAPLVWVAERLGTGQRFSCVVQPACPLPANVLHHMRLSEEDLMEARTPAELRRRWYQFVDKHDTLVVHHPRTFKLISNVAPKQPHCLAIKSFLNLFAEGEKTLEALLEAEGIDWTSGSDRRADERLQMAVAAIRRLRIKFGQ